MSPHFIRLATLADTAVIAHHRAKMFVDMGSIPAQEYELLRSSTTPWIAELLKSGEYVGWLIELDGEVIAGAGAFILQIGPGPGRYRVGRWAHLANVFTERQHRRRGLARELMRTILAWCDANAIDHVTLTASEEGRPLYSALGFKPTSDMRLVR